MKLLSTTLAFDGVLELEKSNPRPAALAVLVGVVFLIGETDDLFLPVADANLVSGVTLLAAYALTTIYAASVGVKTVLVKYYFTISLSCVLTNFKTWF